MPIQITNTLTGKKEIFTPLQGGKVKMYVCGPTVYGLIHIGNARPPVFYHVVRRFFEFSGYDVTFVMNYTDVDDKIIKRALEEKMPAIDLAYKYCGENRKDMESLKVAVPSCAPKVTDHMPQIISFIEGLIEKQAAYVTDEGEVLFAVRHFKDYGKLSKKNIDDLIAGARVKLDEKKRDPLDFALWKPQKAESEPAWDSPWGKGRPGWHIECSVMSMEYLGETFDIHGGGMDLIHPHHENEIAQSEALTGKPFVRYWMHSNMLRMNAEKMSKSLGNLLLCREFVEKYSAEVLKYMLLSGHYRSTIDFSKKNVADCQAALHRCYSTFQKVGEILQRKPKGSELGNSEESEVEHRSHEFRAKWVAAMEDDFNTAKSLGIVFDYIRSLNAYLDRKGFKLTEKGRDLLTKFVEQFKEFSSVFNILGEVPSEFLATLRSGVLKERGIDPASIDQQILARTEARRSKDFHKADAIRDDLQRQGICLRDVGAETYWDVLFT